MKKIIAVLIGLSMIFTLTSCSTKNNTINQTSIGTTTSTITTTTETTSEDDTIDDEAWDSLKKVGQIQTENGIFITSITVPKDFVGEGITQADIDSKAGDTYISGKLNDDGSITYKLTKKQHKAMLDELMNSLEKSFTEMINSKDYSFTSIKHNKDYTQFDVTLSTDELGLSESFATLTFYMAGGVYGIFSGKKADKIIVNYYNAAGKLINTADSSKLGESEE